MLRSINASSIKGASADPSPSSCQVHIQEDNKLCWMTGTTALGKQAPSINRIPVTQV